MDFLCFGKWLAEQIENLLTNSLYAPHLSASLVLVSKSNADACKQSNFLSASTDACPGQVVTNIHWSWSDGLYSIML